MAVDPAALASPTASFHRDDAAALCTSAVVGRGGGPSPPPTAGRETDGRDVDVDDDDDDDDDATRGRR
jgi:hypothetical protein